MSSMERDLEDVIVLFIVNRDAWLDLHMTSHKSCGSRSIESITQVGR